MTRSLIRVALLLGFVLAPGAAALAVDGGGAASGPTAPQVRAAAPGHERAAIASKLDEGWAEAPAAVGLLESGGTLELFTSKDGETWTLVMTTPGGASRIVASGEAWIPLTKLPGQGI